MAGNPMKYSDFITPDGSIQELISQLEKTAAVYKKLEEGVKSSAQAIIDATKKETGATTEGQEAIRKSVTETEKLAQAKKKLATSMSQNAAELQKVKTAQQEQNSILKLTEKLNRSQEGSYNRLSAQYSLNKIRLNKMTTEQRKATKIGKRLEQGTRAIYEEMNRLQKATGKSQLQVGRYELAASKLTVTLTSLNARQKQVVTTQGKNSQAYKLVTAEIRKTQQEISRLTATQQTSNSMAARGISGLKTMTSGYLGVIGAMRLFRSVSGSLIGFEEQMSSVKAISGATGQEMDRLTASANLLGASTSKTATEVAQLQTEYARLGFTTPEILAATAATIQLAEATKENVAQAAETAGATVRAFGFAATETQRVVDVMANSFTSSAMNLDRFAESMKYVAPIAKAAGISLETTTAALSALADAGIHGSQAGTSLRMIISKLDKQGGSFANQLDRLATKGLTLADAEDEVGRRAQTALLVLADNVDKVSELTTNYDNAAGSAKAMADIQRDNVAGALKLATSAWDGFILRIGEGGNVMRTTVDMFADMFRWMTRNAAVIKGISKLLILGATAWATYKLAIWAVTLAKKLHIATTYRTIVAEGLMTVSTRAATGAMRGLNAAIKANPIGLLISLALTAATAYGLFSDSADIATESQTDFNDAVEDNRIDELIETLLDSSKGDYGKAINSFKDDVKSLSETDLTAWLDRTKKAIGGLNRDMANLDPDLLSDEDIVADFNQAKKFYDDLAALIKAEQSKFKDTSTGLGAAEQEKADKLKLSVMAAGLERDLALLKAKYEEKKLAFEKYGLDTQALEEWNEREVFSIHKKYDDIDKASRDKKTKAEEKAAKKKLAAEKKAAKETESLLKKEYESKIKSINQEANLKLSEIDLLKTTEAEKTKLRLQAEKDRLNAILALNKTGLGRLSAQELGIVRNQIKKLDQEMTSPKNQDFDLYSLAGLNLSDEKKSAISTSTEFAIGQLTQFLDAKIVAADKGVELADKEVDNAWNVLNAELESRNAGYASNVTGAQKDLALAKKTQASALKEQEKAQKAKLLLDSVNQASSLVSASAMIWGQLGFPWAIPALAVMWGSFAFSKVRASQITKPTKSYGEGGMEFLSGGSHASGNDIGIGTTSDGKDRRAEGGEALAIFNKSKTRKYKRMLPGIVDSINKGVFEQRYMNAYDTGAVSVNVSSSSTNLTNLENSVSDIRKQGERRYYTDGQGRTIETYKNLKRRYVN